MALLNGPFFSRTEPLYWDPPYYHRWISLIASIILLTLLIYHTYRFYVEFNKFRHKQNQTINKESSDTHDVSTSQMQSNHKRIMEFPSKGTDLYKPIIISHVLVFGVIGAAVILCALEMYATSAWVQWCRYLPSLSVIWYYWSKKCLYFNFVLR